METTRKIDDKEENRRIAKNAGLKELFEHLGKIVVKNFPFSKEKL